MAEQNVSKIRILSVRHITAYLYLGTWESTSALLLGTTLNNKITKKKAKMQKKNVARKKLQKM